MVAEPFATAFTAPSGPTVATNGRSDSNVVSLDAVRSTVVPSVRDPVTVSGRMVPNAEKRRISGVTSMPCTWTGALT